MKWQGRRQSDNILMADPKKERQQVDPQPYLPGRTRMPFDVPLGPGTSSSEQKHRDDLSKTLKRADGAVDRFKKGGMVKGGRDYAKC